MGLDPATFLLIESPSVGVCAATDWVQTLEPRNVGVISICLPVGQTKCSCVEPVHVTSPALTLVAVVDVPVHSFIFTCALAKPKAVQLFPPPALSVGKLAVV